MPEHDQIVSTGERRFRGRRLIHALLFYLCVLSLWALALVCPECRLCGDSESFIRRASAFHIPVGMVVVLLQPLWPRPSTPTLRATAIFLAVFAIDFAAYFAAAACRGGRSMRLLCAVGVGVVIPVAARVLPQRGIVSVRPEAAVRAVLSVWFAAFGVLAVFGGDFAPGFGAIVLCTMLIEGVVDTMRDLRAGAEGREMDAGGGRAPLACGQDDR